MDMQNFPWKSLIKPGLALLLVVIGCAVAARFLAGQETLAEYAAKNQEAAAATAEDGTPKVTPSTVSPKPQATETDEEPPAPGEEEDPVEPGELALYDEKALDNPDAAASHAGNAASSADTRQVAEDAADASTGAGNAGTNATAGASAESAGTGATASDSNSNSNSDNASGDAASGASDGTASGASSSASTESTGSSNEEDARVVYQEGFFYEPISESVKNRIMNVSYPSDCPISLDVLRYLNVKYIDFYGETQTGEIICNERIAKDLVEIFYDLYDHRYPIESIKLIDDFDGDDDKSMVANNTSCFNYRTVAGSSSLSRHALGLAIDINPLYNPWINYQSDGSFTVSPVEGTDYADRTRDFAHKITEDDLCYKLFNDHGFFWGGHWNNPDYQHFQLN